MCSTAYNFGLGLTSIVDHFERIQVVKCELLNEPPCDSIRALFKQKVIREAGPGRKWRVTKHHGVLKKQVEMQVMFSGQQDKAGLGTRKHKKTLSPCEFRKLMSQANMGLAEEKGILHSHQLPSR